MSNYLPCNYALFICKTRLLLDQLLQYAKTVMIQSCYPVDWFCDNHWISDGHWCLHWLVQYQFLLENSWRISTISPMLDIWSQKHWTYDCLDSYRCPNPNSESWCTRWDLLNDGKTKFYFCSKPTLIIGPGQLFYFSFFLLLHPSVVTLKWLDMCCLSLTIRTQTQVTQVTQVIVHIFVLYI